MSPAEAASWAAEYTALSARWEALSARLADEGDSVHVRARLRRLDALMGAMLGDAGAMTR